MPLVTFGEYRPDISDYEAATTRTLLNVVPRGDGYGPFPALTPYAAALSGQCRGAFVAYRDDGSVQIFAATDDKIYTMSNTTLTWSDVSRTSLAYDPVPSTEQWRFVQFNNFVIAVQANVEPQVFNLELSSAFGDLGGSPPRARYVDVVGRFIVLSGLVDNPYQVRWSGLNEPGEWTVGVNSSDFQDLPDGGIVRGVAGGETGVIFQDQAIRRMSFVPGSPIIFQIERIAQDKGLYAPYSLVRAGERIFFYSSQGFHRIDPGGYPVPIGRERVDRTFLADLDKANPQLFIGASDPRQSRVYFAYKSLAGSNDRFDKMLCYDFVLDRFTPIEMSGEYLLQMSQPGMTLEGLDELAPLPWTVSAAANNGSGAVRLTLNTTTGLTDQNFVAVRGVHGIPNVNATWPITVIDGTRIDLVGSTFSGAYVNGGAIGGQMALMTIPFDDFSSAVVPEIAAFDDAHVLGFFRGENLEAQFETAEQGTDGRRLKVRGFRPVTDAAVVYGSLSKRETQAQSPSDTAEVAMNTTTGRIDRLISTRYCRARLRIPAGTSWSFMAGVETDMSLEGAR